MRGLRRRPEGGGRCVPDRSTTCAVDRGQRRKSTTSAYSSSAVGADAVLRRWIRPPARRSHVPAGGGTDSSTLPYRGSSFWQGRALHRRGLVMPRELRPTG